MAKNIFKSFSLLFILIFIFLALGLPLFQIRGNGAEIPLEIPNFLGTEDFNEILKNIIKYITLIGSSIAIIMIIYAGLLFMTAAGDEQKITKARQTLTWALVGLAIILVGNGWVYIVQEIIGAK